MSHKIIIAAPGPQGPQGPPGSGSGPGAIEWGDIGGTLSAQTDLQAALNDKANDSHTHAASDIDSGRLAAARLPQVTGPTLYGRAASTAGNLEEIGLGSGLSFVGKDLTATGFVGTARSVIAGTGLTGGGTLDADRTFAVDFGTTAGTAAQGNDARLSDERTPTDNTVSTAKIVDAAVSTAKIADAAVTMAKIAQAGASAGQVIKWNGSAWAPAADETAGEGGGVSSITAGAGLTGGTITSTGTIAADFGTAAGTIAQGNDSRFTKALDDLTDVALTASPDDGDLLVYDGTAEKWDLATEANPTAHTHGLTDSYTGQIDAPTNRTYIIDVRMATARTITGFRAVTDSGSCKAILKSGATTIATIDPVSDSSLSDNPSISQGARDAADPLTIEIEDNSSAEELAFVIEYTRPTGAIA